MNTNIQPVLIFENISTTFSLYIFVKQFFIQLLFPFFICFTNISNTGFGLRKPFEILHYLLPISLYLICFVCIYSLGLNIYSSGSLWITVMFYTLQKFQIAIKYACLSENEYNKFMKASYETSLIYNQQMMLISGWLHRSQSVIDFELSAAALRCGIELSSLYFIIPNPNESVDKMSQFRNW